MASSRPGGRVPLLVLVALFFLSGASALVYQVLWMRLLALVFGVTVHAASTVLAAFMAGLALGSVAAGRLADRVARPLRAFALAEALIAAAALATPVLLAAVEDIYVVLHGVLGGIPGLVTLIRLALSFAVLLVPTTLMGATLPLVVKSSLAGGALLGRQVSLLYAGNTAGAITGVVVAGIWLVPQLGMDWTFRIGALVNLTVAAAAYLAASPARLPAVAPPRARALAGAGTPLDSPAAPDVVRRLVLLTLAVSGFGAFALEIVWFRMLVLMLRPTTYAFTVMLATVLAGIAAGSWIATPLAARRRGALGLLATLEVLLALSAVLSMAVIGRAADVYAWAAPSFAEGPLAYFGPMAITSVAAILPAALVMGMAFPIGIAIWVGDAVDDRAGERVGFIYAVNVAGAVAGSLVTGFAFLPLIGSRATLLLAATLTLAIGLLLLGQLPRRGPAALGGLLAIAVFAVAAVRTPDPVMALLRSRYPAEQPVWTAEDGHASVTILRRTAGVARPINRLYINGMHQASDEPGMVAYHRRIGTLPMAAHPDPRNALVIGVGGGATAGAVAAFSDVTAVDVVELSPAVVRAARRFSHINAALLVRPNVRIRVGDGRNHMLLTRERYDVITADVILPVHAGAGNLYSVQYYELMKRVLREGGVALQWIGSGTDTEYKLIMRTFLHAFPHTTLWDGGTLMLGSDRPLVLDPEAFARKLRRFESREAMRSIRLGSFEELLALYVAGPDELRAFVGEGPLLTDERPLTEYFLSLPRDDRPVDLSGVRSDPWRHVRGAGRPAQP